MTLRVLMAAAMLSIADAHAVAVQENSQPLPTQAATSEINSLIHQLLPDRIPAKDIPDYGLLRGATRIAVRSDLGRFRLGQAALPVLEGYELRLLSTADAQAEADRTRAFIHFIAIENVQIAGDTASLWIGVDFTMPSDHKGVKMCCCSRALEYRRIDDRWVFVRWRPEGRCS